MPCVWTARRREASPDPTRQARWKAGRTALTSDPHRHRHALRSLTRTFRHPSFSEVQECGPKPIAHGGAAAGEPAWYHSGCLCPASYLGLRHSSRWGWGGVGLFWAFGMSTASLTSTHHLSAAPRRPPRLQPPKSASGRSDVLQGQISPGRGPLIRFQHPGSTHWAPLRLAGRRVFPGALGLEGSSRPPGAAPADQPPRAWGRADSGGGARAFAAFAPSRSRSPSLPSGTVSPQSSEEAPFFFVCFPLSPSDMLVKTEIFLLTFRAADGFVRD